MKYTKGLVSIIIPSYNDSNYVLDAINSALAQTYKNIEVIVINDGSTREEDIQFFKTYKHPKVKILTTINYGLATARDNLIGESSGEYFVPLDADDKISPDFVEKTIEEAKKSDKVGVVFTDHQYFENSNTIVKLPDFDLQHELLFNDVSVCSLIKRETYDEVKKRNGFGYNPNMKYGYEDWDFWISVAELGYELKHIKIPLFLYRKHGVSMITKSVVKHEYLMNQLIDNHLETYKKYYKELLVELHCTYLHLAMSNNKMAQDIKSIWWLIKRIGILLFNKSKAEK